LICINLIIQIRHSFPPSLSNGYFALFNGFRDPILGIEFLL